MKKKHNNSNAGGAKASQDKNHSEQDGRAGRAEPASAGPPTGSPNMGSPVTPHVGISRGDEIGRFLSCGIDTLYLTGYVKWGDDWPGHLLELTDGKGKAQALDRPVFLRDSPCGPLLISAKGKPPMFRFHLEAKDFNLYLGISPDGDKAPNAYLCLKSRSIWGKGLPELVRLFGLLVRDLGGTLRELKPSRLDLCADFLILGGLPLSLLRDMGVPQDIMTCDIMKGAELETYYIGSPKASIRARMYDKAKEVVLSHKEWFKDIWKVEKIEDIWRVEFQLRREALKAYSLNDVADLPGALGGIWADLTHNWYSLRLQDNANTSRRSVHPFWEMVQACAEQFGPVVERKRKLAAGGNATAEYYSSRAAGQLVGFAACRGIPDLSEALQSFMEAIAGRWDPEDFFEAFTTKTVKLDAGEAEPKTDEGGDDEIPF